MSRKSHSLFSGKSILSFIALIALAIFGFFELSTDSSQDQYTINQPNRNINVNTDKNDSRSNAPKKLSDYYDVSDVRYKGKKLILTKHARCRMGCREIDAFEVGEILEYGKINRRKSDSNAQPCPTYALEGRSRDGQTVRAVIADCDTKVKLITVIDLDNYYKCSCK